jgi:hypothetical protein
LLAVSALVFALLPATPASADADATPVTATSEIQVPYGQMASADAGALQLTFVSVDEDSRCPREVMCVWQGRAVIRVRAEVNDADQGEVALTTTVVPGNGPSTADATIGPYTLRLVEMTPYPSVSQQPGKDEYVATVRVTRS